MIRCYDFDCKIYIYIQYTFLKVIKVIKLVNMVVFAHMLSHLIIMLSLNRVANRSLKCAALPCLEPKRHVPHRTDNGDTLLVFLKVSVQQFLEYNCPASC